MSDFGNRPVDLGTQAYHPILAQRDGDILLKELAANLAPCLAEGIRREFEKLTGLDLCYPEYQTRAGDVVAIAPGIRGEVEDAEQNQLAEELQSLNDLHDTWAGKMEEELVDDDAPTPQDWDKRTSAEKISHLLDRIPKMVADLKTAKESLEHITKLETEKTEQQTQIAKLKLRVTQAEEDAKDLFDTQVKLGTTESRASRLNDELEECHRELQNSKQQLLATEGQIVRLKAELEASNNARDTKENPESEKLAFLYAQILPAGWENRPDPWAEIQAIFSPEF